MRSSVRKINAESKPSKINRQTQSQGNSETFIQQSLIGKKEEDVSNECWSKQICF